MYFLELTPLLHDECVSTSCRRKASFSSYHTTWKKPYLTVKQLIQFQNDIHLWVCVACMFHRRPYCSILNLVWTFLKWHIILFSFITSNVWTNIMYLTHKYIDGLKIKRYLSTVIDLTYIQLFRAACICTVHFNIIWQRT